MEATIANLSARRRRSWTTVTVPRVLAADFGPEATFATEGQTYRAARGRTTGLKTVYRIQAELGGHQTLTGEFRNEAHPTAVEPFTPHPWVADDIAALFPSFAVRLPDGRDFWDRPLGGPIGLDGSAAHQRWWLRRWIPELGLIMEWWGDILHDDPVIQVSGKIVWSHRTDPASNKRFDFFAIRAGEYIALDFEKRHNVLPGIRAEGFWGRILTHQPMVLNDGSGLPVSGSMLTFINVPKGVSEDPDAPTRTNLDLDSLFAANDLPTYGVCHNWDGYWCANMNAPRFRDEAAARVAADQEWNSFRNSQQFVAGYLADRPLGSALDPGRTGDQEDFGACKGTYAVALRDPRFIHVYKYAVQAELFRGYNHYEANGQKLQAADHPQWVTWSTGTHYSTSVSPDRLGKDPEEWGPPGTGYWGHDDQHYTFNNLAAYAMLSDDPWVDDLLAHRLQVDKASYRIRFGGTGATRAQGRTLGSWAHFASLYDGAERHEWVQLIRRRVLSALQNPELSVPGPMKVLTSQGPDPRKPVYLPNGELGPWTSFWELGLALVGLYNAHKASPSPELAETIRKLSETMVTFGFFEENNTWYTVGDTLWKNGEAVELSTTSREITWDYGGGVTSWTFAGILVAREFLGGGHPRFAEVSRYIRGLTGDQEAADRRAAEWWAAVRGIVFEPAES